MHNYLENEEYISKIIIIQNQILIVKIKHRRGIPWEMLFLE